MPERLTYRHGERNIDTEECDVNVRQRFHFSYGTGIAGHVKALAAQPDHVAITVAFWVLELYAGTASI
jgi:hypothetical protein